MANVHGFRDLRNTNPNQNHPQPNYNNMGGGNYQNQQDGDDEMNLPFMCKLRK